ncbi:uncharacterized protein K460DRAFT_304299 [Cucurbitaria berberidis CBS 394.84]|uniref:Uncharacterized protein n=1 Tax=Cucurbitaria berberidis CBS 394.84 TaxID=1168544 RepID=A0A9P4LC52_9PLEO|nr:uncharacterized protein K460DRAFT_304299 [Cucurbitaria berberidis CBS 394.84]KAF1848809.1 hypothetical protein K460DRAFT_304299 [Cucurbitaria berberidis CBS 394.84]
MPKQATMTPKKSSLPDMQPRQHSSQPTPILAFCLVVLSLSCIVGCIAIVYTARGRPVASWIPYAPSVQPAVLLSLLSNISGTIQKYVCAEGITIVWWRTLRKGTTLADLHYIWSKGKGTGIIDTLRALFHHKAWTYWAIFVFLVTSAVSVADGPLLQRSITPVLKNFTYEYEETLMGLNKIITDGWVGRVDNTAPAKLLGDGKLDRLLQDWHMNRSTTTYVGCSDGNCSGSIAAAGIYVEHVSSEVNWVDLTAPENANATLFSISFNRSLDATGSPVLLMTHSYMSYADNKCNSSINVEKRTFRTAVVKYDVVSQHNNLRLNRTHWPQMLSNVSSPGDLPAQDNTPAGPLAALEYFGYYYLMSFGYSTGRSEDGGYDVEPALGTLVNVYWDAEFDKWENDSCPRRWKNATEDLIWNLHEVMFWIAWYSTTGNKSSEYPIWKQTVAQLAYNAELITLWLASGMMLLCLFAILSLFWGFWELDREVSLSPIETGRALAETILSRPEGTAEMDAKELIEAIGDKKVKLD